jgi:hypothetical protein
MTTTPPVPGDAPGVPDDASDVPDPVPDAASDPVPDVALDRIRASDPAGTAEPDLERLRAVVADRTTGAAAAGARADGAVVSDRDAVSELATARAARATGRRRGGWVQVAAAVAGLAVIGGGSWALGRLGQTPVAAPVSLGGSSVSGTDSRSALGAAAPVGGAAIGSAGTAVAPSFVGPGFGERTVFVGSGLSAGGASGTVWGFDPASVYTRDTVAKAASVLGVSGTPSQQGGAWVVGPQDGTGPTVLVQPDGLASLSYNDPTRSPWACLKSAPDTPDASVGSGGSGVASPAIKPAPGPQPTVGTAVPAPPQLAPGYPCATTTPSVPAPTGDAATAEARGLMSSLGVDPGAYRFAVQANEPVQTIATQVTASQVLDGQLTGVQWSFTLLADGVQSLNGALAPVVDLGTYSLISPADAVARLGDPRFGAGYGSVRPLAMGASSGPATGPVPALGGATAALGGATASPGNGTAVPQRTVPPAPRAGSSIPWPVRTVTLTSSRRGLGMTTLADGAVLLLPSYELGDGSGSSWSTIAVADDRLDFSPR